MVASDQFFRAERPPGVVPVWFRILAAPLLLILALPLSLLVMAVVLGLSAAGAVLRLLTRDAAAVRPAAGNAAVLTDVDYVVLDDPPRRRHPVRSTGWCL